MAQLKYEAKDGTGFDTAEQADLHDEKKDAIDALHDARRNVSHVFAKSMKTADGYDFGFVYQEYWYIANRLGGPSCPQLRKIMFTGYNFQFDEVDEVAIHEVDDRRDIGCVHVTAIRIGHLYAKKDYAELALLAALEEWHVREGAKIEELREKFYGKK